MHTIRNICAQCTSDFACIKFILVWRQYFELLVLLRSTECQQLVRLVAEIWRLASLPNSAGVTTEISQQMQWRHQLDSLEKPGVKKFRSIQPTSECWHSSDPKSTTFVAYLNMYFFPRRVESIYRVYRGGRSSGKSRKSLNETSKKVRYICYGKRPVSEISLIENIRSYEKCTFINSAISPEPFMLA